MSIWMESYLVFTWEFANSGESIREFSHQVISGFDALRLWCSCWRWFCHSCCLSGCCACQASVGLGDHDSTVHLTTANLSYASKPKRAGPGVTAMYQDEWIMCGWGTGVFGCQGWGHGGFHTEESETCCRWLAWFKWGPGQWAGHLGWFVLGAVVEINGGVVCYLQIWCQPWHGLRWCLYCWHLQGVLWPCMLHCTAGNWCCQWSSPLGARLLLFHSPLQQQTGLCVGVFSLFWLWQLVFSPLFVTLELGLMTGCLQTSGARAVTFCLPVTLFPTTFTCWVLGRAVVSTRRVLMGAVGAWSIWCLQLLIMCLVGVAYSMYCMTHTHCSHSWFNSVVCSADL